MMSHNRHIHNKLSNHIPNKPLYIGPFGNTESIHLLINHRLVEKGKTGKFAKQHCLRGHTGWIIQLLFDTENLRKELHR